MLLWRAKLMLPVIFVLLKSQVLAENEQALTRLSARNWRRKKPVPVKAAQKKPELHSQNHILGTTKAQRQSQLVNEIV